MAKQIYDVPVVPVHFRKEESLHQMLDSLAFLDNTVDDIFSKITASVLPPALGIMTFSI